jgi:hypothetical protein
MAYPFLPVNPSCGTVVVNNVCGCSSVVTNSGCNNNDPCSTTITASSTIVYNGPILSCIIAEPCDTLNVILQKIDEIICNLLNQINALNIQVNNITNQIININNEIVNINNTLDVCCTNVTTTTTTTTAAPTTTTTTTAAPTTTTTTTAAPTTTTTTTTTNCVCMQYRIYQTDLDNATGNNPGPGKADNTVYLTAGKESDCNGGNIDSAFTTAGVGGFCIKSTFTGLIELYYYRNDIRIDYPSIDSTYVVLSNSCTIDSACIPT